LATVVHDFHDGFREKVAEAPAQPEDVFGSLTYACPIQTCPVESVASPEPQAVQPSAATTTSSGTRMLGVTRLRMALNLGMSNLTVTSAWRTSPQFIL
jgi:hypothetical protein